MIRNISCSFWNWEWGLWMRICCIIVLYSSPHIAQDWLWACIAWRHGVTRKSRGLMSRLIWKVRSTGYKQLFGLYLNQWQTVFPIEPAAGEKKKKTRGWSSFIQRAERKKNHWKDSKLHRSDHIRWSSWISGVNHTVTGYFAEDKNCRNRNSITKWCQVAFWVLQLLRTFQQLEYACTCMAEAMSTHNRASDLSLCIWSFYAYASHSAICVQTC